MPDNAEMINWKFYNSLVDTKLTGMDHLIEWLVSESRVELLFGYFDVVLVGDKRIAELHQDYMGIAGATDVITFDLRSVEGIDSNFEDVFFPEDDITGEIYVSLERAMSQAEEYNITVEEELGRLFLHGLLHLSGWKDDTESARHAMRQRENEGLARIRQKNGSYPWKIEH